MKFKRTRRLISRSTLHSSFKQQHSFFKKLFLFSFNGDNKTTEKDIIMARETLDDSVKYKACLKGLTKRFKFFLYITIAISMYCLYLVFFKHFSAALISMALILVFANYTFRYHIWLTQAQLKKNSFTLKEYFHHHKNSRRV